jgi:hypothetical protein
MSDISFVRSETEKFLRGRARRDLDKMFLRALGCPFVVRPGEVEWPKVSPADYADVRASLPQILSALGPVPEAPWDRPSLLSGLYVNACWRTCLETEAGTYDLAAALLTYLERNVTYESLDVATAPVIRDLLNEWLAPAQPWGTLPSVGDVLQAMFGQSWCYLSLSDDIDFYTVGAVPRDCHIGEVIHRDRPVFLSGLVPEKAILRPCDLPQMKYPA